MHAAREGLLLLAASGQVQACSHLKECSHAPSLSREVPDRNSPPHASRLQPRSSGGRAWLSPLLLRFWCSTFVRTGGSFWGALRSTGRIDRPPVARTVRRGDRRRVKPIRSGWGPLLRAIPPPPVASTRWARAQAECQWHVVYATAGTACWAPAAGVPRTPTASHGFCAGQTPRARKPMPGNVPVSGEHDGRRDRSRRPLDHTHSPRACQEHPPGRDAERPRMPLLRLARSLGR
jgi:hypothetical protein